MLNFEVYVWNINKDKGSLRIFSKEKTLKDEANLERYKKDKIDNTSSLTLFLPFFLPFIQWILLTDDHQELC